MKCMVRNKVKFYYAPFDKKEPCLDEYGNETGEYTITHGNPIEFSANISAAKGETQTRQFGENESYDKVIALDSDSPAIDEYSILWIDIVPQLSEDGSLLKDDNGNPVTPHDYVVKKVAKSLNNTSIAISKVNVNG